MSGSDNSSETVIFLASPGVLGAADETPEVRETHMSWVFLTKDRVFKMKKPVRFPYLDFSSRAAREAACREELRINRLLAPDVYLRLARLTRAPGGALELDGAGDTLESLVVMRRLAQEHMLDARLQSGAASPADMERLVALLADFYRQAPRAELAPEAYAGRFDAQLAEDRRIIASPRFAIDHDRASTVMDRLDRAFRTLKGELRARVEAGRIVEGHGDLRPEHISLGDRIRVIDRLEFNRELRLVDPFDELAFLGMECAMIGGDWVAPLLVKRASDLLGGAPSAGLIDLYTGLRASLRARLSLAHLLDEVPREPEKWAPRAERYLDQAAAALRLRPRAAP